MEKKTVIIVGAGLAGSLMAIYLVRRGYQVKVYESRADMRKSTVQAGRSINLALSDRGILALKGVDLDLDILKEAVPMPGRMLHSVEGDLTYAPYGKNEDQYINSISRAGLNMQLMDQAESYDGVELYFNMRCESIDLEKTQANFTDLETGQSIEATASFIIGGDGANSAVRRSMINSIPDFDQQVDWLDHGYKELTIPAGENSAFRIEKNALHIWPRGNYMLIALPNNDGSFTCTLFFPMTGSPSFEELQSDEQIQQFFEEQFGDAVPFLDHLIEEFHRNPVGKLGTLTCSPWIYKDKVALIGDAAHAIVPFYGQGMNASFEDCRILDQCLENTSSIADAFALYYKERKENGDAIGALAIENFYEMRDHVADPVFRRKRTLEFELENTFSDYASKYSLVTFHPEVTYHSARQLGNKQDSFLMEYCREGLPEISADVLKNLHTKLSALK